MNAVDRPRRSARAIAATIAAAAAIGSAALLAAPAAAAPAIDPDDKGMITIHKFREPVGGAGPRNVGTPVSTTGYVPLAGVEYTVQRVTSIDLTTPAGWTAVNGLTASDVLASPATYPLGSGTPLATDGTGTVVFADLNIGAYLVTETAPGDNNILFTSEPVLVTIPLPINGDWLYDVHIYPKGTVADVTKSVDDAAANTLGDTVTWTVHSTVPVLPDGESLTEFGMTDIIDSRLGLEATDVSVTVAGVSIDAADFDPAFDAGTSTLTVAFTPAGIAKIASHAGAAVTFTIPTVVKSIGNGSIDNTASVYVNDPADLFDSNTVTSSWGALQIIKHAGADTSARLEGAVFELYRASDTGLTTPIDVAVDPIRTGSNGTVLIEGLKAGDYLLVEREAPLGYQANSTPIPVTVIEGGISTPVVVEVSNSQIPAFLLPFTGGSAAFILPAAGLLFGAGLILLIARRRRTAHA